MASYQQPGIYVQPNWSGPQQQTSPGPQPQQTVTTIDETHREGFAHHHARRCATVQIACAMGVIFMASVLILTKGSFYMIGTGFWGGTFFIVAGSIGIRSSIRKQNCPIIGTMVFSILACLAACVGVAFAVIAFLQDYRLLVFCFPEGEDTKRHKPYFCLYGNDPAKLTVLINLAVHTGGMLFNSIEFFAALVQSGICCRAVCCGGLRRMDPVVVYVPYTDEHHEQGALLHGRNSGRQGDTFAHASAPPMEPPPYSETPEHRLYPALT